MNIAPVMATTFYFKSPGEPGLEGVFTGKLVYDKDAVNIALSDSTTPGSSLTLGDLGEDYEFQFEYISPYSGVMHTEESICGRDIGEDINNSGNPNVSFRKKEGPFFQFNVNGDLASFNLISCVGDRGDLYSSISDRDRSVAYSELQIVFNRALFIDADYTGIKSGRRYTKKFPISVNFEAS
ncbi:MAG: hypothetical protein AAGA80_17400 [Cyanobacteria bacterium P01_F01_bin.143]